ncbi:MAG: hypothetical protein HOC71_14215 [Candidatus Latescibacteria bacterium]|nr:hypothetical protein [Candidatus Latescibacterota bacterium]
MKISFYKHHKYNIFLLANFNIPKRNIYFILLFILSIITLIDCGKGRPYSNKKQPLAVNGILDLRGWDFRWDGPVVLDGEWEFYWKNILYPSDFPEDNLPQKTALISVPSSWGNLVVDGKKLPRNGYATYRLKVFIDQQKNRIMCNMFEQGKAFTLFVNGEQISVGGMVGKSAESTVPETLVRPKLIAYDKEQIEIIIQVSNFHGKKGGIQNSIRLGTERWILASRFQSRSRGAIIFGFLSIMGLYHLVLYLFRRKDNSPLYFIIICFFLALYTMLQSEVYIIIPLRSIQFISWAFKNKLISVVFYLTVPFFLMFINSLFPKELSKRYLRIIQITALSFVCFIVIASTNIHIIIDQIYQIITLIAALYVLYVLILALKRKREGAGIFLSGFIVLFIAGINDILNPNTHIELVPSALIIFILTQAIFLSYRFSYAFNTVERQSKELEQEIRDREKAEEESRHKQQQLLQADKMASLGILVSGVAHEINNPNNFILLNSEMLSKAWKDLIPVLKEHYEKDGEYDIAGIPYTDAQERIKYLISGITDGAKRIEKIIQGLRSFSRLEAGEQKERIDINAVVDAAILITNNLIKKSTNHFDVSYGQNLPLINGNFQRLEQVIINLITNACQALQDKNQDLLIKTNFDNALRRNIIEIRDEGVGILPDQLNYIMDPFFTTKRDSGGTGLGLSISYSILQDHGGELNIESEPGKGTTATVSLPVTGNN